MFTYSLSTIKNSKNARTFDAFLCKVHKYACEKAENSQKYAIMREYMQKKKGKEPYKRSIRRSDRSFCG